MDFELGEIQMGDKMVISVSGDLDVVTAPRLRDRLIGAVEEGERELFVDLTPCQFVDSSGLSALVTGLKRIRSVGGELGLICPAGHVRRLLQVVALDQVFTVFDDREALSPT